MSSCPKCMSTRSEVKDSRRAAHPNYVLTRRRRICKACDERFTTFEVSEEVLEKMTSRNAAQIISLASRIKKLSERIIKVI